MLGSSELTSLFEGLESDRVERKAVPKDRDRICQAICAFANDLPNHGLPGVIFIGQNDDGSCANTPITDEMLQVLSQMRDSGRILPIPARIGGLA